MGGQTTVTCVQVSKRKALDPSQYEVVEDDPKYSPPVDTSVKEEDVIPRRNRGRPGTKEAVEENVVDDRVSKYIYHIFLSSFKFLIYVFQSDKEKFKEWKATMKISPEEIGLFKKWKQEQGRSKKQLKAKEVDTVDSAEDDAAEEEDEEEEEEEEEIEEDNKIDETENKKSSLRKGKQQEDADKEDSDGGYEDPTDDEEDGDDYPAGVTEYDPPDSQHSCTDVTMTDRLLQR